MKKLLTPLFLFCVLPAILPAQIRRMTFRYDSNSIIQDTAGHILPRQEWHSLMTRGDYVINHQKDSAGRMYGTLKQLTRAERVHLAIRVEPEESTTFTILQRFNWRKEKLKRYIKSDNSKNGIT
jgi:hypothetical protein